jgi:lipid II isoglutaminyl synthase (glutamine-hydrolysing)
MKITDLPTIWLCKVVYWVLRKRGSHGAALPGLIAEKLNPGLVKKLCDLPEGIIVVSGTNGKTTTTHLTAEVLRRAGKRVFTNHSGSNMTRGLLASIVRFSTIGGKLPYDIAVLEIDEAYAAKLSPVLRPRAAILTNVLRDQLDRFGEIDHTANLLAELARNTTELVVCNANDSRFAGIATTGECKLVRFGFAPALVDNFPDDDALYAKSRRSVPHKNDFTLKSVVAGKATVSSSGGVRSYDVSGLPGWHNAINITAVVALVDSLLGESDPDLFVGLQPPYGRGEAVLVGDKKFVLQLVKNPAGFRTSMGVLPGASALVVINDFIADGRDVSWLWDVDFSSFADRKLVLCSGTRGYDIAVRLKYSEVVSDVEVDVERAILRFVAESHGGVVFLSYTAMLSARKVFTSLDTKK